MSRSSRAGGRRGAGRGAVVALAALVSALVAGCARPGAEQDAATSAGGAAVERSIDYADALFDVEPGGALRGDLKPYLCGEETHLSKLWARPIELEAGQAERVELVLAACQGGEGASEASRSGTTSLVVRVDAGDGTPARELDFALGPEWRTERIDLGASGSGGLRVRIERRGPREAAPVFVRDAALRVERPLARPRAAAPRALLVSLDTFRHDAPGATGGAAKTPALDAFLAEAERFEPHWAAEVSTKPSHASLLTGLPVAVHGCDRRETPLGEGVVTLAERLRDAGVATAGFASQPVLLGAKYGFAQGFDRWRNELWSPGAELRAAAAWLAAQGDRPAFAFVHLYAAHSDGRRWPYESDARAPGAIAARFGLTDYGCRDGRCASSLLLALNGDARASRLPREGELLRALYDAGVETLDRDLGAFFDDLRRAGLWERSLVVVTADHGEAFDEHGFFLHVTAHEEILRVPLAIRWPRGARDEARGAIQARPSTALDVAPTLLAHFGIEAPDLTGADLARPASAAGDRAVMTSLDAVRRGDWKLLLPTDEHAEALYDLARDAGERIDRLAERPADAAELRALRDRFVRVAARRAGELGGAAPVGLDEEEIAQLRALGYLP